MSMSLPEQLAELRGERVWGVFERGEDPKYKPINLPGRERVSSCNDPETLGTWDEITPLFQANGIFPVLSLALASRGLGRTLNVVDVDVDKEGFDPSLLDSMLKKGGPDTFTERSPSGVGYHLFYFTESAERAKPIPKIGYDVLCNGFVTITGAVVADKPILKVVGTPKFKKVSRSDVEPLPEFLPDGKLSPIYHYNIAHPDPRELLAKHGYQDFGRKWGRPGSKSPPGIIFSESWKGPWEVIWSFHQNDPLCGTLRDPFDIFRILEHGGDNSAALRAAARETEAIDAETGEKGTVQEINDRKAKVGAEEIKRQLLGDGREPDEGADQQTKRSIVPIDLTNLDEQLKPRPWIMVGRLIRGHVSALVGPPGVGKTVFQLVSAVDVAIGGDPSLYHVPVETCNAWFISNEEDSDELRLRLAAICRCHNRDPASLVGRFFLSSGYGQDERFIVLNKNGNELNRTPQVERMIQFIRENDIGALFIEPLVSLHNVEENNNTDMHAVFGALHYIAQQTGCAVEVGVHTKKPPLRDSEYHAGVADAARGGYTIVGDVRVVWTLAAMSQSSAEVLPVDVESQTRYVRLDDAKENYTLRSGRPVWLYLQTIPVPVTGDDGTKQFEYVGVPIRTDLRARTAAEESLKDRRKREQRIQESMEFYRDVVRVMGGNDMMQQAQLVSTLEREKGCRPSTAARRLQGLPDESDEPIEVSLGDEVFALWREKESSRANAPVMIKKADVTAEESTGDGDVFGDTPSDVQAGRGIPPSYASTPEDSGI